MSPELFTLLASVALVAMIVHLLFTIFNRKDK